MLAATLAAASSGCDREAERREEAKALLEKLNAVTPDGSLRLRKAALDALQKLPLRDAGHAKTRDLCHHAHLQLLNAEAAQASARRALEEATQRVAPGGGLAQERSQAIAQELASSNDALVAAQKSFPACQQAMQKLLLQAR